MFTVDSDPRFTHAVEVTVPVDGGFETQTFRATFRVQPADRDGHDLMTVEGSTDFLKAAVVELHDLVDAANKPVAYNDRVRDQLFALPYVRIALTRTYYAAIGKAAEGN